MTKAPMSLNEALVAKHFKRGRNGEIEKDDAILALVDAVAAARTFAEQISAAHDAIISDATKTETARLLESRKVTQGLAEKAAAKLDAARTKAEAALADIRRKTSAPVAAMNDAEIALDGETRSALKAMSAKDRGELIADAIKSGNDSIVRAVLNGHAFLSGLGKHEIESYRHSWRVARFNEEVGRETRIKKALAAGDIAGGALVDFAKGLAETPAAKLAASAAQRAADATAAAQVAE